jgi:type IV secretory pathway VirB2 component (pilin)
MEYGGNTEPDAIGTALGWLQGTLLGSIGTTVAVIAVASVGFLMLTGRIEVRRAVQVVFGCFILFGASSIAQGIISGLNSFGAQQVPVTDPEPPLTYAPSPPPSYPHKPAQPFDPYAGAAVPTQQ